MLIRKFSHDYLWNMLLNKYYADYKKGSQHGQPTRPKLLGETSSDKRVA